jgi:hypothetical protein
VADVASAETLRKQLIQMDVSLKNSCESTASELGLNSEQGTTMSLFLIERTAQQRR